MGDVEDALTRFSAGELNEDELRTVIQIAVRRDSLAEVSSVVDKAAETKSLQDICARLLRDMLQASSAFEEPALSLAHEGMVVRDRFVLEEEIGRGGMGVVYRARDLRRVEADDRHSEVAIKVMNQALQHHPDALITLQREARRTQQLAHPNIATVFDFDREGDIAYLCMELLEGKPLNAVLEDDAERSTAFSLCIIRGICDGLAYAHECGIVHADLKPGNIFLTRDNVVKILDFGLARTVRAPDASTATETLFDAGRWQAMTPAYASPEMFARQAPDPCDDIYGLACVSYELLSGQHPFSRLTAQSAMEEGLSVKPIPGLTRRQNKALKDALAFRREDRTATVAAFLDGLTKPRTVAPTVTVAAIGVASVIAALAIAWLYVNVDGTYPGQVDDAAQQNNASLEASVADADSSDALNSTPVPQSVESRVGQTALVPENAGDTVAASRESQESIERILEIADLHLAMRRFVTPSGSNAAEAYLAVTTLDPANERAKRGLDRVTDGVIDEARVLAESGNRGGAIGLLEEALDQLPNARELRVVHRELTSAN